MSPRVLPRYEAVGLMLESQESAPPEEARPVAGPGVDTSHPGPHCVRDGPISSVGP